ncbi:MAG: hypothetical protein ACYC46_12390 [Acidobacteriaceae bacterium]
MQVSRIIAEIDAQIEKLQQARKLLAGAESVAAKTNPGRPRGSKKAATTTKRKLSPEGRKRIAEAMKRRWEEHRKKKTGKQTTAK